MGQWFKEALWLFLCKCDKTMITLPFCMGGFTRKNMDLTQFLDMYLDKSILNIQKRVDWKQVHQVPSLYTFLFERMRAFKPKTGSDQPGASELPLAEPTIVHWMLWVTETSCDDFQFGRMKKNTPFPISLTKNGPSFTRGVGVRNAKKQ